MAYNGKIIRQLIEEAGLTAREFSELTKIDGKELDLHHVEVAKSVTCRTLERMRNALHCSMDRFFTQPDWDKNGTVTVIGSNNIHSNVRINQATQEISYLKDLLNEKDERIKLLNRLLSEKDDSGIGQKSDEKLQKSDEK